MSATVDFTELNGRERARIAALLKKLPEVSKLKGLRKTLSDYEDLRAESGKQGIKLENLVKAVEKERAVFRRLVAATDRRLGQLQEKREETNTKIRNDFYRREGNRALTKEKQRELDDLLSAASLRLAQDAERLFGRRVTPMNLELDAIGRRILTEEEKETMQRLEERVREVKERLHRVVNFHRMSLVRLGDIEKVLNEWVDGRYMELVSMGVVNADISLTEILTSLRERRRDIVKRMNRARVAEQEIASLLKAFRSPQGSDPWTVEEYATWTRNISGILTIVAVLFSPLPVVGGITATITMLAQGVLYVLQLLGLRRGTA